MVAMKSENKQKPLTCTLIEVIFFGRNYIGVFFTYDKYIPVLW